MLKHLLFKACRHLQVRSLWATSSTPTSSASQTTASQSGSPRWSEPMAGWHSALYTGFNPRCGTAPPCLSCMRSFRAGYGDLACGIQRRGGCVGNFFTIDGYRLCLHVPRVRQLLRCARRLGLPCRHWLRSPQRLVYSTWEAPGEWRASVRC